jgi:hypothetical protein
MAAEKNRLYGLVARFNTQEDLVAAASKTYQSGYRKFDAYTPYPVESLGKAMGLKPSPLPMVMLCAGIVGGLSGFAMQWFSNVIDYPLNIGNRPLFSWPAYIPITFEMVILLAAFGGIIGLFIATRLPQPYHPVFNFEDFLKHGAEDGFYLGIEASDPQFDLERTRLFLEGMRPAKVAQIEE